MIGIMQILVVDDDKLFTEPLIWRLKREGYEVRYCKDINAVLDEDRRLRVPIPDCIILDIMMPGGDTYTNQETDAGEQTGLRLLEDIQKQLPSIPVIIVTVHNDLSFEDLGKRFGNIVGVILVKPVTPTEVIEAINNLFPQSGLYQCNP